MSVFNGYNGLTDANNGIPNWMISLQKTCVPRGPQDWHVIKMLGALWRLIFLRHAFCLHTHDEHEGTAHMIQFHKDRCSFNKDSALKVLDVTSIIIIKNILSDSPYGTVDGM